MVMKSRKERLKDDISDVGAGAIIVDVSHRSLRVVGLESYRLNSGMIRLLKDEMMDYEVNVL